MVKDERMGFEIPEHFLSETKECSHNFSCLKTDQLREHCMCEVQYGGGRNLLFLVSKEYARCPYRMSFGYSQVCRCPTRYAIFHKYKQ